MIEYIHQHIISELQQNTRTDTIFILSAIILNLLTLSINSAIVEKSKYDDSFLLVMFLFVVLIVLVNIVVVIGLTKGKQTRVKLVTGLLKMYKDKDVDKYYDESLLGNYIIRYNLFIMVVTFTGIIAIIVPFILR